MFEEITTLEALADKKAELRSRIDTAADADLDNLETELKALETRESELRAQQATTEKRARLMQRMANGTAAVNPIENPVAQRSDEAKTAAELRAETLASKEYRSAFAKVLMRRQLTATEQRALDTVVTTTADTFVAATSSVDGVNNGGVAIPTELNLSLLKALELQSPIFRDINKTSFAGVLKFPYAKTKNKAKRYGKNKETTPNDDGAVEFGTLTLETAEISVTIPVTWRLEAMSVDQFMGFLLDELKNQVGRAKIAGALYGSGTDDMKGVCVAAIQKSYSSTPLEAIEANLGYLSAECKIGAKIYISTTAAEAVQFAKDSDGKYIFPINMGLPKNIAGYALETDPYLDDGDILIGNLTRFARLNVVEAMTISKDVVGKKRQNEYTAYEVCGSDAQPDTLLHIKKTSASE